MAPPTDSPKLGSADSVLMQTACGAALGFIAGLFVGAGHLSAFGLFFGAIVGLVLSPIATVMFRPDERTRAITVALVCAVFGITLNPKPPLLGPTFVNAVGAWIGALIVMRFAPRTTLTTDSEYRFVVRIAPLIVFTGVLFAWLSDVRSWPEATDPASALVVVNKAFRSNAMEVHPLGYQAFSVLPEAEAEGLSRDADDGVRLHVARALTGAQSDEFARTTLDRLATDADWLIRLEAYWSMARRWPEEIDAVAARMRADAHPNIRESADRVARVAR